MLALSRTLPLLVVALSGTARAYDGPPVDFNFVNQKPAKYAECDKYLSDNNARRYAACEFGRDEAERMAQRFGGGNGRVQGYLRGFAWGLNKMTKATQNDGTEMENGRRAVDGLGQYMESGLARGRQAGHTAGSSQGSQEAISRFVNAVNSNREPSPQFTVPATHYQGEDGAYVKYVGPVPTPGQIVKKDINVGQLRVYDSWDAVYLGEKTPLNVWDLWFDNGTYVFEKARWFDGALAMKTWFQRPIDTRPKYDNLNNPPLMEPAPPAPAPAPGQPPAPAPAPVQVDLQGVFQDAFRKSYAWYVNYYFSSEFQKNLEDGQLAGEQIGIQVGKRVAHYRGLELAFNQKFKESSASTYRDSFTAAYTNSFNASFQDYAQNPKLSIVFDGILGNDNDGILQPGEAITARFTVKNVGGVGSPLSVSVGGTVVDGSTQTFNIPRLRSQQFLAERIAKVDPRLRSREVARVVLDVNGFKAEQSELVNRMIELTGATGRVNVSAGAGEVQINATNIATVRTPSLVTATLSINGTALSTEQVGFIEKGQTATVSLPVSGLDPLWMIQNRMLARVVVKMGEITMDETNVDLTVGNSQHETLLYFDALANGRGFVPRQYTADEVLAKIRKQFAVWNEAEVNNRRKMIGDNPFKHDPNAQTIEQATTMAGKVAVMYRTNVQTEASKRVYDVLAAEFWAHRKGFNRFIGIKSARQLAYQRLVRSFSTQKLD